MMKELLTRVINQLDKLDDKLDSVDKTLVKQEENLREHMRRTELLERQHENLQSELYSKIDPIKYHVHQVKGIAKFISIALPLIAAAAGAVYKYLM